VGGTAADGLTGGTGKGNSYKGGEARAGDVFKAAPKDKSCFYCTAKMTNRSTTNFYVRSSSHPTSTCALFFTLVISPRDPCKSQLRGTGRSCPRGPPVRPESS
jgi:hypothetical protein